MAERLGGSPDKYRDYVSERLSGMRFKDIYQQYCSDNKIVFEQGSKYQEMWKCVKLRKLALYFSKDESEFTQIVNDNPQLKFREILQLLKDKGTYDFHPSEEEMIKTTKRKFRRESKEAKHWIRNQKHSKKEDKNAETPQPTQAIPQEEAKVLMERGKILNWMKNLFGEEKEEELIKFISENRDIGE
jgi:hypothetical protein